MQRVRLELSDYTTCGSRWVMAGGLRTGRTAEDDTSRQDGEWSLQSTDPPEQARAARPDGWHDDSASTFLDTGAMYRTVALAAIRQQIPWHDQQTLAALASELDLEVTDNRVLSER